MGGERGVECLLAGAGALAAEERGHDAQGQLRRAAEVRHRRAHLHTTTPNHVTALSSLTGEAGASRGPVRTMTGVSSVPVEATMPPKACAAPSKPFRVASGPTGPKPEHTCRGAAVLPRD